MPQNIEKLLIHKSKTVKQAMRQMNELGKKELYVIADDHTLFGSLSDGDVRKWILKEGSLEGPVSGICNLFPKTVKQGYDLEEVKQLMLTFKIESVPLVNERHLIQEILYWDDVFAGKVARCRE